MKLRLQWICFILICYATSIDDAGALSTYVGNVADTQNTQFTGTANTEFSNEQQYVDVNTGTQDKYTSIADGKNPGTGIQVPDDRVPGADTDKIFIRPTGFGKDMNDDILKRLLGDKIPVKTYVYDSNGTVSKTLTGTCYTAGDNCPGDDDNCGIKILDTDKYTDEYKCAATAGVPFHLNGYAFKYANDCRFGSEDYEAS